MTAPPAPPVLDADEQALFDRGVRQFNDGYFFECHDTLEELWQGLRGPGRDFFQGLIQVSVAYYHLSNGNRTGAASMLRRALRRFSGYPGRYFGFDLEAHRGELETWLARLDSDAAAPGGRDELPFWRFEAA